MKFVEHKLATGAMLTGYLRDETTEMPSYNTRPAVLILPGGGYRYCSSREADPVAVQFLQAGYHVFTLIYSTDHAPLLWQPLYCCRPQDQAMCQAQRFQHRHQK